MIHLNLSHEGFAPGAHVGIRELLEGWVQNHLQPLLAKIKGEMRLHATVQRHAKGEERYTVNLVLHLPRKALLVARAQAKDIHAALSEAENKLLREVQRHNERLHGQAEYRRKARRARLRALKAMQDAVPQPVQEQTRRGIEPLLPQLERVVRRELAYLRASGELPIDDPSVQDVVDQAVVAVIAKGQTNQTADALLKLLLREAFKVLNAETEARRRYGEVVSLESPPPQDANDQAEAMVEEEIYEYYQPDEALQLDDVLPDPATAAADEAEREQTPLEATMVNLVGLPILWRRVWMLAEYEGLGVADIAPILELEQARAEQLLERARAFLQDHLQQLGY